MQSIGYAECVKYLEKNITEKQLRNEIIEHTRQLAKRQITWLRSDPELRFADSNEISRIQKDLENTTYAVRTPP